jgi:hypothetical protein
MDPILIAAARQLMQQPDDADGEAFMRQATGGKYGADDATGYLKTINTGVTPANIGRSLVQGATMGFGDDAVDAMGPSKTHGLTSAVLDALSPGMGRIATLVQNSLGTSGEDMRARDAAFGQAHPWLNAAARMAGGAGAAVGASAALPELGLGTAVAKAPAAIRAAYALLKGSLTGYGIGATTAAGDQENPEGGKDWKGAATSLPAIGGTLLGAGIPAAIGTANYIARPTAQALNRVGTAVTQSKGIQALLARLEQFKAAGLGDQVTLGDLSGPMGAARKFTLQNSEEAAAAAVPQLEGRQALQTKRLMQTLRTLNPEFGTDPLSNKDRLGTLAAKLKAWREGPNGYDALNPDQTVVPNTNLVPKAPVVPEASDAATAHLTLANSFNKDPAEFANTILSRSENTGAFPSRFGNTGNPAAQNAQAYLDHMSAVHLATGEPVTPAILTKPGAVASALAKAQQVGIIKDIDPETATLGKMMHIQQQLQDRADVAITAGGGRSTEGFALKKAAQALDAHLAENNPDYLRVNNEYKGHMRNKAAVKAGMNAWNGGDPEVLLKTAQGMSDEALLEFRRSIASSLNQQFNKTGILGDAARSILDASQEANIGNASPATQMRLKMLFHNDENYNVFMKHAALEHQFATAKSAYTGSDTYRNWKAATTEPVSMTLAAGSSGFAGSGTNLPKSSAIRMAMRWANGQLQGQAANEMHDMLNTPGATNIEAFLRSLGKTTPLVGPGATTAAPAAAGSAIAALQKQLTQP